MQHDWQATNNDVITIQSHSFFACSRQKNRQIENGLRKIKESSLSKNFLA
jgi:hypothetical protein